LRRGPFARWVHTHRFVALGTRSALEDDIEYELPLGPLGAIGGGGLRAPRSAAPSTTDTRSPPPTSRGTPRSHTPAMHVAITGSTGSSLRPRSLPHHRGPHRAPRGARPSATAARGDVVWDPARGTIDAAALEG
jgi:hypothetical protein